MNIAYPLQINAAGRTSITNKENYVEQLIEQVLFTMPGERVNRPDFGSDIMQMVFAAGNNELLTACEFLIKGALQKYLSNLIQVEEVQVKTTEAISHIVVTYRINITQEQRTSEFNSPMNALTIR
jgi:uncharacterized protein